MADCGYQNGHKRWHVHGGLQFLAQQAPKPGYSKDGNYRLPVFMGFVSNRQRQCVADSSKWKLSAEQASFGKCSEICTLAVVAIGLNSPRTCGWGFRLQVERVHVRRSAAQAK